MEATMVLYRSFQGYYLLCLLSSPETVPLLNLSLRSERAVEIGIKHFNQLIHDNSMAKLCMFYGDIRLQKIVRVPTSPHMHGISTWWPYIVLTGWRNMTVAVLQSLLKFSCHPIIMVLHINKPFHKIYCQSKLI